MIDNEMLVDNQGCIVKVLKQLLIDLKEIYN